MRFKREILLLVAIIITLCACSSNSSQNLIYSSNSSELGDTGGLSLPIDVNSTTVDIMVVSHIPELNQNEIIKELSRRTGININIITVNESQANLETKKLMGINELPDILCGAIEFEEINSLGIKGTFTPVNKYLNELPNFKRIFVQNEEYSSVFDKYTATDGNLYVFPGYETEKRLDSVLLYRKDIFDKHKIKMWNNHDEFYQTLKQLKEIYPSSTPYISKRKEKIFEDFSLNFGINFPGVHYDSSKNIWVYSATDERCKEMLDFMRKLYTEDLINKDFLTVEESSWSASLTADNKSFITFDSVKYADSLYESVKDSNPNFNLRYARPISSDGKIKLMPSIFANSCVTNNENKLISLKLLDYLLSSSGAELMTLGVKNKTYITESNGKIEYLGFDSGDLPTIDSLEEKYGLFIEGLTLSYDKKSLIYDYSEKESEALNFVVGENRILYDYPKIKLTKEEKETVLKIQTDLTEKAYTFAIEYITTDNTGEEAFNNWKKEAYELGVDKILSIYNK